MTRLDRALCLTRSDAITEGLRYAVDTLLRLDEAKRRGIISLRAEAVVQSLPGQAKSLPAAREIGELLMPAAGAGS
jgi:hypothetical protein